MLGVVMIMSDDIVGFNTSIYICVTMMIIITVLQKFKNLKI